MRNHVVFYLNGTRREVGAEQARLMLADYLRYSAGLTGTKIVCAEGDCGACTILRYDARVGSTAGTSTLLFLPVNSCILPVAQLDGCSIVTVDALGDAQGAPEKLTPVQDSMRTCHGSQCGFCTPGFVMALTGLVEKKLCAKKPGPITEQEAKNACTGNLCRCTGYQPIVQAAMNLKLDQCSSVAKRFFSKSQALELRKIRKSAVLLSTDDFEYFAPVDVKQAQRYLAKHKDARVLGAATDLGVVHNKGKLKLIRLVSLHLISELFEIEKVKGSSAGSRLLIGARVTLSEVREALKRPFPEAARFFDLFASPQIKNVATLVGNVANASPIADTPPFLLVSDTVIHILGPKGRRAVPLEQFFVAYRKTALKPGELILSIEFSVPEKTESVSIQKVSERKDLDISSINAAFRVRWENKGQRKIQDFRIALGGVAATPIRLAKTEKFLNGAKLDASTVERAAELVQSEIEPLSDVRGSAAFRRVLVDNVFRRFCAAELM
jgi:xanthine dehydrogenase small subunit